MRKTPLPWRQSAQKPEQKNPPKDVNWHHRWDCKRE
jgi:hypothetical protein